MIFLAILVVSTLAHPDYSETWEEFKEKFNKEYESEEEENQRSAIWSSNVDLIKEHNGQADAGVHSFHLGENAFADLTTDEIRIRFNGFIQSETGGSGAVFHSQVDLASLPDAVDWRQNKTVTPVKNQLHCGSCWAFSATGSLEGQHALKTGALVSLSEQNLVDCAKKEGNHGCAGGLMDFAFKYVKDNKGIDTEASYPYTAKTGKTCLYNATNSGANLTSWIDIPHMSEADLQKAVGTVGPISVAIDASRPTFHFYKKGVYHDHRCSSKRLDHGVLAVGYGSAKQENGRNKDFWLVKNSWGEKWGMDGYIQMVRNERNACGIATQASYPVV